MKSFKIALAGLCALLAASCAGPSANIEGVLADAPSKDIVVKMLNVNTYSVLDTVKTDASGKFSYKLDVLEGQPEFVYLFYGDTRISSLLLKAGDKVKVSADTLGNSSVEGSDESVLLQENEKKFADFLAEMNSAQTNGTLSQTYVKYYRDAVKYVMTHSGSLTVVPVLFQNVNSDFPVFSQATDALQFRAAVDSLKAVYPESKYVKALDAETVRRERALSLNTQINLAPQMSYPDIKTKDVNGNEVQLSAVSSKAILINFWTATDAATKIFNIESLKPLYEDYHKRGLEIFQVSLDADKAVWASVVRSQELPWISVNDGLGTASPAVTLYNVTNLPQSFLIIDGELVTKKIDGDNALRRELDKVL